MLNHRLLNSDLNSDFKLIGICSSLKDTQLTYLLNASINTRFKKCGFVNYGDDGHFSKFVWEDDVLRVFWSLISNKDERPFDESKNVLFPDFGNVCFYFLPQEKQLDYLIKIEGAITSDDAYIQGVIKRINSLEGVFAFIMKKEKQYLKKVLHIDLK